MFPEKSNVYIFTTTEKLATRLNLQRRQQRLARIFNIPLLAAYFIPEHLDFVLLYAL
jgi:hypothetical protein